jgi:hypothetical protein
VVFGKEDAGFAPGISHELLFGLWGKGISG